MVGGGGRDSSDKSCRRSFGASRRRDGRRQTAEVAAAVSQRRPARHDS